MLIRWVAIAGQALTLLFVHYGLRVRLPLVPALAVVVCSVLLNLAITLYWRAQARLGEREAALFLGYDLLQLGAAAVPDRRAGEPVLDPDPGAGHGRRDGRCRCVR